MFLNLLTTCVRTKSLTDNLMVTELTMVECAENFEQFAERLELKTFFKLYDIETLMLGILQAYPNTTRIQIMEQFDEQAAYLQYLKNKAEEAL